MFCIDLMMAVGKWLVRTVLGLIVVGLLGPILVVVSLVALCADRRFFHWR